jgi:hypothetical protein
VSLRENECVGTDVYNLVTVDATSPISQANTPLVKDFVRCATFSALCLIPYFKLFGIIHLPRLNYFRAAPYTLFMPVLIFTAILVLSITFTIIVRLVRRTATPRVQAVIFAASVMLLVPAARELLDRPFSTVAVTILCCIALAVLLSAQAVRAMGSVLMALSFLVPVQAVSALWGYMRQPPASQFVNSFDADRSTGTSVSGRGRILWLIFDELDDELAFPLRPADVKMPELDRLRSESVYVAGATPAAGWTLEAIPGMLVGKPVESSEALDFKTLRLTFKESESGIWSEKSSVFSDAHAAGLRTAIVGWYHPYCRVFTTTVDHCEAYMPMTARIATYYEALFKQVGFGRIIKRAVTLRLGDTAIGRALHMGPPFDPAYIFREEQVAFYERIRTAAKNLATDPSMGFIVVHWNVPHPQGIYDRTNNRIETRNKSNYFDNLELMDAAISELRAAMTAAGVWDTTTIILTSDHPLRPELWGARTRQWSLEEETLTQKRRRSAIPFIIKLAGHNEGITYEGSYDVFHTRELIAAIRAGEVSSHSGVVSWLEKHSRTTPMAAGHRP